MVGVCRRGGRSVPPAWRRRLYLTLELSISIEEPSKRMALFGPADHNLRLIRSALDVRITARDSSIKISGHNTAVSKAAEVIDLLQRRLRHSDRLTAEDVADAIAEAAAQEAAHPDGALTVYSSAGLIVPRTPGQQAYVQAMLVNDLIFCVGPAGTGKTYLAVAVAVSMLRARTIKRIVLVRPAVEAGEKLGYLPGDMQAKVNPYLRPLFDAMHDMMSYDQIRGFMQNDVVEVIPLAFMRGRTLNSAAVILDEAQNTTVSQMLMFLTRLGHDSKMIVTGDDSQVDLDARQTSGMVDAVRRLGGIEGIAIVRLQQTDIVRHRLVQNVVEAYGNSGNRS